MQGLFKIIEFIHESEMNDFKQLTFRQDTIKKKSDYHCRNLVETKMDYIKLLGDKFSAMNL